MPSQGRRSRRTPPEPRILVQHQVLREVIWLCEIDNSNLCVGSRAVCSKASLFGSAMHTTHDAMSVAMHADHSQQAAQQPAEAEPHQHVAARRQLLLSAAAALASAPLWGGMRQPALAAAAVTATKGSPQPLRGDIKAAVDQALSKTMDKAKVQIAPHPMLIWLTVRYKTAYVCVARRMPCHSL